jgi:NADH-quinone oxidoreductase subunit L
MPSVFSIIVLLPVAAILAGFFVPRRNEILLARLVLTAVVLQLAGTIALLLWWIAKGAPTLDVKSVVLYESPGFEFFISYYFDRVSATFLGLGAVLAFLVTVFSRYYMHRDDGFKRYFLTLLLFLAGYNLVVLAGNFETLFIGWEMLGITSFLLIAFYRDRYLPVKNAYKVLSFYRLGDACLILVMWMSHHLWHKNITFAEWNQYGLVSTYFSAHYVPATFIAVMIVVAAAIKSAQLPFSTWLSRAMEGPTTSSAIFYGSLSVHIGAFLLLRTYAFWENEMLIKALIIATGLVTSVVATAIARVQSTVKTQIAYASIAQIGLIFIEIALGFHALALVHIAGNAFLRTYQLLVSPSVLSYLVHNMFFNYRPRRQDTSDALWSRLKRAVYILSIKEWNFDYWLYRYVWVPFKSIGRRVGFLLNRRSALLTVVTVLAAGCAAFFFRERLSGDLSRFLPVVWAALALALVLYAFNERGEAIRAWLKALLAQFFMALALAWNKHFVFDQFGLYLSGFLVAAAVGYVCLRRLEAAEGDLSLDRYHGHSYEHRGLARVFLLACLGFCGFPITPTFIGIDLMFTHIEADQVVLAAIMALNFLFLELTIIRVYARIFLGQHKKVYHPVAFKSS